MKKRILVVGVTLVVSQAVRAGETLWTGAADAFWTNAVNWTAGVPSGTDTAKFDATGASGATTIDLDGAGLLQKLVVTGAGCPKYTFGTSSAQTLRLPAIAKSEVDDTSYGIFVDASVPSANAPVLVATLGGECRVASYCYQRIENNSSGTFVMNDFGDYTAAEAINVSGTATYPEPCFFGAGPIEIRGVCVNSAWPERKCKIVTELGLRGTGNVKVCKSFSVNRLFGEGAGAIVRSLEIPEGVMLSFTGAGFQWIGRAQMHIYGGGTIGFYAGTNATFENSLGNANYTHVVDVAVTNLYGTAKAVGIRYYGAGVHYYNYPDNDLGGPLQLYSSSDSIFLTIAAHKFGKKGEPSCVGRAVSAFQCERNAAIRYIGTEPDETDRDIVFGTKSGWEPWNSKARIDQCGSGTFTYSGTFTSQDGARSADLVLAGTGTADGILTSTLADQPNYALTLTKQESCRWVLTGANTHTGATTVEAGTLALGAGGSIENSPVVLKGGTFAVLSGVATTVGRVEIAGGDQFLDIAAGATLTVADGFVRSTGRLNVTLGEGGTIVCPALAGTSPNWMSANGQAVRFAADGTMAVDPAPVYAYSVGETVTSSETFVFHDGATLSVTGLDRLLPGDSLYVLAEFPHGYTGTPRLSAGTVLPEGWELVLTSTQFLLCNTSKEYRLDLAAVDAPGDRINFFVPVAMSLAHCEGYEFDFYSSNPSYAGSWAVATYVRGGSTYTRTTSKSNRRMPRGGAMSSSARFRSTTRNMSRGVGTASSSSS